jgi:DNA-directed RNA polymerase specialized sigma24 family protein
MSVHLLSLQIIMEKRVVLILFYYHKMTMSEISDMLGVAENTLRKRQQSALEKIRRLIRAEFVQQENVTITENFHSRMGIRGEGL